MLLWTKKVCPVLGPETDPEIGGSEAVGGRHVGGGGGMCVVGVDVGKQGAHDSGYPRAHVLGGEAGKVAGGQKRGHWVWEPRLWGPQNSKTPPGSQPLFLDSLPSGSVL